MLEVNEAYEIRQAIQRAIDSMFVALPAVVTEYDAGPPPVIKARPLVRRPIDISQQRAFEELPIVQNIPVLFPSGGGAFLTWPIEKGDSVILLFCDYSLANARISGEIENPTDASAHSIRNAVAIPANWIDDNAPTDTRTDAVVVGYGSGQRVVIEDNEIRLGDAATDYIALAGLVETAITNAITGHTHASNGAPGVLSAPVSSTAASKSKAE